MVIHGKPFTTAQYKRDYKRMKKRVESTQPLLELIQRLGTGKLLPRDKDHALRGEYYGCRESHVKGDWVLVYEVRDGALILRRTGTHSDIFKKKY